MRAPHLALTFAVRLPDVRRCAVQIFEMSAKKRERCLQEVTLLQQLDHPNIIQVAMEGAGSALSRRQTTTHDWRSST